MHPPHVSPAVLRGKTKIVATLGPASAEPEILEKLVLAGVDVFRLNFSHGTWEWHSDTLARVRTVSERLGHPVAVLQDLCGPKLRLGEIPGGSFQCRLGAKILLVAQPSGAGNELPVSHASLLDDLDVGNEVLLADGIVTLRVLRRLDAGLETEVTLPGEVRSRQGISAPGVSLRLEPLTEKDLRDLDWSARHDVEFIGLSFVRRPADVDRLRQELAQRGCKAQIIAKIEKAEALGDLDGIIDRADGIMVARGDLGVDIDVARVPIVQKEVIRRCNQRGKPVITATQMLESMRTSNRPTRAEASDVANAILDGSDAIMLSAETATGLYPVESVSTMARIATATEAMLAKLATRLGREPGADIRTATVDCAGQLADQVGARWLVAATRHGDTALALSRQRNLTPILGLSDQPETVRRMALYWGVLPVWFTAPHGTAEYVERVVAWARSHELANPGDRIVFVLGAAWGESSYNALLVHQIT